MPQPAWLQVRKGAILLLGYRRLKGSSVRPLATTYRRSWRCNASVRCSYIEALGRHAPHRLVCARFALLLLGSMRTERRTCRTGRRRELARTAPFVRSARRARRGWRHGQLPYARPRPNRGHLLGIRFARLARIVHPAHQRRRRRAFPVAPCILHCCRNRREGSRRTLFHGSSPVRRGHRAPPRGRKPRCRQRSNPRCRGNRCGVRSHGRKPSLPKRIPPYRRRISLGAGGILLGGHLGRSGHGRCQAPHHGFRAHRGRICQFDVQRILRLRLRIVLQRGRAVERARSLRQHRRLGRCVSPRALQRRTPTAGRRRMAREELLGNRRPERWLLLDLLRRRNAALDSGIRRRTVPSRGGGLPVRRTGMARFGRPRRRDNSLYGERIYSKRHRTARPRDALHDRSGYRLHHRGLPLGRRGRRRPDGGRARRAPDGNVRIARLPHDSARYPRKARPERAFFDRGQARQSDVPLRRSRRGHGAHGSRAARRHCAAAYGIRRIGSPRDQLPLRRWRNVERCCGIVMGGRCLALLQDQRLPQGTHSTARSG